MHIRPNLRVRHTASQAYRSTARRDEPERLRIHQLDDPDGEMDDERDKFEDEVELAQRLSADLLPFNHGGHVRWQSKTR